MFKLLLGSRSCWVEWFVANLPATVVDLEVNCDERQVLVYEAREHDKVKWMSFEILFEQRQKHKLIPNL